mmetsp:Transcript_5354/g.9476  ORF Transcript_5354/g.9476 Transcript_5354/m.9476 type:complete len:141 (-) Transcript_5354:442-864(-)
MNIQCNILLHIYRIEKSDHNPSNNPFHIWHKSSRESDHHHRYDNHGKKDTCICNKYGNATHNHIRPTHEQSIQKVNYFQSAFRILNSKTHDFANGDYICLEIDSTLRFYSHATFLKGANVLTNCDGHQECYQEWEAHLVR